MANEEKDVWGGTPRLVRETEAPARGSLEPGKKTRRLKMTGPSYSGLSTNISRGNISKRIAEYNREYERLMEIATALNEGSREMDVSGRKQYDEASEEDKKQIYEDVVSSVNAYNMQVAKLAKLAVGILVFKDDSLKVKMKSSGRPLRVPNKLVAAMYKLTKGGRKRLEEIQEAEKQQAVLEEAMVEAIVRDAQAIMDTGVDAKNKGVEGSAVSGWGEAANLGKYSNVENVASVIAGVVPEPSGDVEEDKKGVSESGEEPKIKPGVMPVGDKNAKKVNNVQAVLAKIKEEETELAGLLAIPSEGKFKLYVKNPDTLNCSFRSKSASISLEDWAKITGIENEEEVKGSYKGFVDLCVMRDAWLSIEVSEEFKNETVFNYVVAAVRDGKTQEEIRNGMPEDFSDEAKDVVVALTEDFDVLTNGVKALDTFVGVKTAKVEKAEEEVVEDPSKGGETPEVTPELTPEEKAAAFNRIGNNVYKKQRELLIGNVKEHLDNLLSQETELSGLVSMIENDKLMLFPKAFGEDGLKLIYSAEKASGKAKTTTVKIAEWGKIVGLEDEAAIVESYNNYMNLYELRTIWENVAGDELTANEDVFNYVVAAVRDGKTQEEIRANMPEEFDEAKQAIVTGLTEDFDKLTNGVKGLDEFVGVKVAKIEKEEEIEDPAKKVTGGETPVIEEEDPTKGKGTGEETPVVEEDDPTKVGGTPAGDTDDKKKVAPPGGDAIGFGARYLALAKDLSDLLKAKKELEAHLEENKAQLAALEDKIGELRKEMDDLIQIPSLGKKTSTSKVDETPVVNTDPVKGNGTDGDTPVVDKKDPVRDKPWHPDLTEEQILYALEKDIYEPVGQEYEQFLNELGLEPGDKKGEVPVTPVVGTEEPVNGKGGEGETPVVTPVVETPVTPVAGTEEPVNGKGGEGETSVVTPVVETPVTPVAGAEEPVNGKGGEGETSVVTPVVETPVTPVAGTEEPVNGKGGEGETSVVTPVVETPVTPVTGTEEPVNGKDVEGETPVVTPAVEKPKKTRKSKKNAGLTDEEMDDIAKRTADIILSKFPGMAPVVNINVQGDLNNQGGNFVVNNSSQFDNQNMQRGGGLNADFREWWETMAPILSDPDAKKKLGLLKGYRDVFASMQTPQAPVAEEEASIKRK